MRNENNQFGKIQKITLSPEGWLNTVFDGSPYSIFDPKDQYEFWERLKVDDNGNVVLCIVNTPLP